MNSAAFLTDLKKAQSQNKDEAEKRWLKLVSDTHQGIPPDSHESLRILEAAGKTVAELSAAVERLHSIDRLNSEIETLRDEVAGWSKVQGEIEAENKRFALATTEHRKLIADLTAEESRRRSKYDRLQIAVAELKRFGVLVSESKLQNKQREIEQLDIQLRQTQERIATANVLLAPDKVKVQTREKTLSGMLSESQREQLEREFNGALTRVKHQEAAIAVDQEKATKLQLDIETQTAILAEMKAKLRDDRHANI